jgi:hypothetical protein
VSSALAGDARAIRNTSDRVRIATAIFMAVY